MKKQSEQQAAQEAYYDQHYPGYKEYKLENWRVSYIRRIFKALKVGQRMSSRFKYLDVGVGGSGYTVIEAARRGATAWGVDISQVGVDNAARLSREALSLTAGKRCKFAQSVAETLPFKDATFDAVSCIAVLEHVVEDQKAMAEIARVLKPGGRCYVSVPHTYALTPWPLVPVIWVTDKIVGHLRHYTEEGLERQFSVLGLRKVSTLYHMHMIKFWQALLGIFYKGLNASDSNLWWRMEEKDLAAGANNRSAMISMAFEKPKKGR